MRGLTGGVASGKSTVSKILVELGAVVLDADQIAKQVMEPGQLGWEGVARHFPQVIQADRSINRRLLGDLIFSNPAEKAKLEAIIHPLVLDEIKTVGTNLEKNNKIVFADIPLLYETNSQQWLDEVWLVYVPYEIQLQRLMDRDSLTELQAKQRIAAQMSLAEKRLLADVIIDNSGSIMETRAQVERLWNALTGHNNVRLK
ncbi:MAG: dephospho-CoA kinase [Firmicutes bacterium]|nr:dephospho-CoA kinase [Bacillota bacterium]